MDANRWYHPHKYAKVETERRWLIEHLPADLPGDHVRITDRYLVGTRLRLRLIASPIGEVLVRKLGQKYHAPGQIPLQTTITTIYLNEAEYRALSALGGLALVKRRYAYPYDGVDFSIDVFEGALLGLVLLETEGRGAADITDILVPSVARREVTGEAAFTGGELAALTLDDFQCWRTSW